MKIGLVCPYNIAKGGGVQEVVRALCDELNKRGHDAKIITPQPREYKVVDTANVIFVGTSADFKSPMSTTAQVSASGSSDEIDSMLEREQFDVLHFHEPWVPMLSRQILSRSSAVNVATFHAKIPESIMSQTVMRAVTPYLKSVLKYLHDLTAVSEAAAEYIGTLTDDPIAIVPNGIDLSIYKATAHHMPKEKQMILYIGRLERRKSVKYLLQAYALVCNKLGNVELVIAGDGPDRAKLEAMVEDMELPHVTFLGYVTEAEKLELLQTADLFCSPAVYGESFGIVLLEAMASGVPIVAGNNAGYRSVMQGLGALSLIEPANSAEFATRLELLLSEPKLRQIWQEWAAEYIKQYSYNVVVDQYEEAYQVALAEHESNFAERE